MTLPQALQQAVDRLSLADVVVKSISTTLAPNVVPGVNLQPNDPASFQLMTPTCQSFALFESLSDDHSRMIVFEVKAGVRLFRRQPQDLSTLSSKEVDEEMLATIEASFLVSYTESKKDEAFVEDDSLHRFGAANVPFNVWPFWRELVQSACSRMSLPRVVLPTHRLKKRDVEQPPALESPALELHPRLAHS